MPETSPLLAFRDTGGEGRPVLFLHGFAGDRRDWADISERLSASIRAIAVDFPGHGETGMIDEEHFAMPNCASAVIAVLDHLDVHNCDLVAYSMGGRLALYLLVHHGDRFGRTVLESTTAGIIDEEERRARRKLDEQRAREIERSSLTAFFMKWYEQPMFAGMGLQRDRFESLLQRRLACRREGLAQSLRAMGTGAQAPLWDRLGSLEHNILFIAGQLDGKFRTIAERMSDLCPHAELCIIPRSGHNVHFEQPDRFYTEVESFLISRRT